MSVTYQLVELTGGGGGGGDGSVGVAVLFNATTSWGSPVGGEYIVDIVQGAHGKGLNPFVQVFEKVGANYEEVAVSVTVNPLGDIKIAVTEIPDLRFEGKIIIGE